MPQQDFRIVPLQTNVADNARRTAERARPDHVYVDATSDKSCPCRHCLQWARAGERVILFPFAAIPPGRPYSESGPIFVHAEPCERYSAITEYPAAFRTGRVIRAYNSRSEIIGGEIVDGLSPEQVVMKFLRDSNVAFLQVRSATNGCFTFKIERR